ncbi:hypothetical protein Pth03_39590 [Planotetraspora thailandica]|uniref:Uncharacterized protein n=1 Tax=Planotetraspora thailandica TaxID=487172 RepID=A0A8J3V3R5_9ACTN|nr:hypothetical protein Pth03_39590 [Planotetraspora thailandica]
MTDRTITASEGANGRNTSRSVLIVSCSSNTASLQGKMPILRPSRAAYGPRQADTQVWGGRAGYEAPHDPIREVRS